MNCLFRSIGLRAVLTTLTALLSLFMMDEGAPASIWWSGDQNVELSIGVNPNITYFDLNGDGSEDFAIRNDEGHLIFVPLRGNVGVATSEGCHYGLRPLPSGTPISLVLPPPYLWLTQEDYLASSSTSEDTCRMTGDGRGYGTVPGYLV